MLIDKILARINAATRITDYYRSGYGNFCGTTLYQIDGRLGLVLIHNGCDRMEVIIDGQESGHVDKDAVYSRLRARIDELSNQRLASL
jgi:hypothetical protein